MLMKKPLLIASGLLAASIAQADPQAMTIILNAASPMTQGVALVLTNQMQAQGSQVHVLLCDKAGDLALKDATGEKLKPQDITPAQLLDAALKKGATASVCALYLPNSGNTAAQLKEGITPAKPDAMARTIMDPQRKVLVF